MCVYCLLRFLLAHVSIAISYIQFDFLGEHPNDEISLPSNDKSYREMLRGKINMSRNKSLIRKDRAWKLDIIKRYLLYFYFKITKIYIKHLMYYLL